jgi:hypothetical protein
MQFANGGHGDEHGGDGEGLTKGGLGSPPPPPHSASPCAVPPLLLSARDAASTVSHPAPAAAVGYPSCCVRRHLPAPSFPRRRCSLLFSPPCPSQPQPPHIVIHLSESLIYLCFMTLAPFIIFLKR